jgi:flavin-binding protein dodecin
MEGFNVQEARGGFEALSQLDSAPPDIASGSIVRVNRAIVITRRAGAEGASMSVAKVSEISATSSKSFEDAIQQGLARAGKTLRHIRGAWIKEQYVRYDDGGITEYQVNMMVTFVLDD